MVATHGRAMQHIHIRDKNPKGRSIMSKIGSREKMIINSHDSYSCPMYDISQVGMLWRHVPMMVVNMYIFLDKWLPRTSN